MSGSDPEGVGAGALGRAAALWEVRHRSIALNDGEMVRPATTEGFWRVHCMLLDARAPEMVRLGVRPPKSDPASIRATWVGHVTTAADRSTPISTPPARAATSPGVPPRGSGSSPEAGSSSSN
jgi:hypothetical protein